MTPSDEPIPLHAEIYPEALWEETRFDCCHLSPERAALEALWEKKWEQKWGDDETGRTEDDDDETERTEDDIIATHTMVFLRSTANENVVCFACPTEHMRSNLDGIEKTFSDNIKDGYECIRKVLTRIYDPDDASYIAERYPGILDGYEDYYQNNLPVIERLVERHGLRLTSRYLGYMADSCFGNYRIFLWAFEHDHIPIDDPAHGKEESALDIAYDGFASKPIARFFFDRGLITQFIYDRTVEYESAPRRYYDKHLDNFCPS